jgi:AcrR family transcriptional regulator
MTQPANERARCEAIAASKEAVRGRILGAAFRLLMERGYASANTLEIATRAKVSKRELYALFGSKRGILTHMVTMVAARMRVPLHLPELRDRHHFTATLVTFGATVLREVTSPPVMAIYRLAANEAEHSPEVASALDAAGREATRSALAEWLCQAQKQGFIGRGEPATMGAQFLALLWGDLLVRILLRLAEPPGPDEAKARARAAAEALLVLYPPQERLG